MLQSNEPKKKNLRCPARIRSKSKCSPSVPGLLGILLVACFVASVQAALGDDRVIFSGPQVGEPLPPLKVTLPLVEDAGEPVDAALTDGDHPHRLIVFVHQRTRPSVGFLRVLGEYGSTRKESGLATSVVFLGNDATEVAGAVRRARGALPKNVLIGVSPDGLEGPGEYGLNREVTLTILVASEGKVTFNSALIDPSLPLELPKVLVAICETIGGEPPTIESLMGESLMGESQMGGGRAGATLRRTVKTGDKDVPNDLVPGFSKVEPLLRAFIRIDNSDDRVDQLAKQIDEVLQEAPEAKQRLKEIAGRVYEIYGTDHAKVYLQRWAGVGKPAKPEADSP